MNFSNRSAHTRGVWAQLGSPLVVSSLVQTDFDWIGLDGQHGRFDRAVLTATMQAIAPSNMPVMFRVPSNDFTEIGFALDVGVDGVIVPMVDDADDARKAVTAAYYPPIGSRSWGQIAPFWGASGLSSREANNQVECWVMIETAGGLANLDAILDVPGITGVFVGPSDLSLSLGFSYDKLLADDSPTAPLRRIALAAAARSLTVGIYGGSSSGVFRSMGYATVVSASDADLLSLGASVLTEQEDRLTTSTYTRNDD